MVRTSTRRGFTLIELMIVVAIIGILAAIAIPAFVMAVRRSKTAEASAQLNNIYKGAAAYYLAERSDIGIATTTSGYCTIGPAGPQPATPGPDKQAFTAGGNFAVIGFTIADYVYYSYSITSAAGSCGHAPGEDLYTFTAVGDLDGDSDTSLFELPAATNKDNQLYHARGIYIIDETE